MAPHSNTLAWKIPWTEGPGRLQSQESRRVGHDWMTSLSLFSFMHWRRNGNPLQCSCLENPRDGGAWWAAIYGVAQSRTRLTWLSSSSSRRFIYSITTKKSISRTKINEIILSGIQLSIAVFYETQIFLRTDNKLSHWCMCAYEIPSVVSNSMRPHGL